MSESAGAVADGIGKASEVGRDPIEVPAPGTEAGVRRPPFWRRFGRAMSFRNISAVYVFAVLFVVFSLWVPSTFLLGGTWKSLLDSQAETAMLAVGLVIALSAGAFDLAVGAELGFGSMAAGVKGLQLAGAPVWIPDLFNGAALLLAVGMARYQWAAHRTNAIRRLLRFNRLPGKAAKAT